MKSDWDIVGGPQANGWALCIFNDSNEGEAYVFALGDPAVYWLMFSIWGDVWPGVA